MHQGYFLAHPRHAYCLAVLGLDVVGAAAVDQPVPADQDVVARVAPHLGRTHHVPDHFAVRGGILGRLDVVPLRPEAILLWPNLWARPHLSPSTSIHTPGVFSVHTLRSFFLLTCESSR